MGVGSLCRDYSTVQYCNGAKDLDFWRMTATVGTDVRKPTSTPVRKVSNIASSCLDVTIQYPVDCILNAGATLKRLTYPRPRLLPSTHHHHHHVPPPPLRPTLPPPLLHNPHRPPPLPQTAPARRPRLRHPDLPLRPLAMVQAIEPRPLRRHAPAIRQHSLRTHGDQKPPPLVAQYPEQETVEQRAAALVAPQSAGQGAEDD